MALTRVLQLLRILADHPAGLALTPLCVAMNAPKTSVLSLLRGLTTHGYLQHDDTIYQLGPESFSLGASLVSARSLDIGPALPARGGGAIRRDGPDRQYRPRRWPARL
jgi:DNA-binding IclR family transcriptional regulator